MSENLTVDEAEQIVDELANLGIYDVEVREGYSGRGMYGKEVVAFVADGGVPEAAIGYAAALLNIPFEKVPCRTDSMGLGWVLY